MAAAPSAAQAQAVARKRPSARRSRSTAAPRAQLSAGEALVEELALLRRAQRALTTRPVQALSLVRQHERDFTHSSFVQERETLAIEALLRAGRVRDAHTRAAAFGRRFPESAYGRRIADLMAGAHERRDS
jgi:hypothetical protein